MSPKEKNTTDLIITWNEGEVDLKCEKCFICGRNEYNYKRRDVGSRKKNIRQSICSLSKFPLYFLCLVIAFVLFLLCFDLQNGSMINQMAALRVDINAVAHGKSAILVSGPNGRTETQGSDLGVWP